MVIKLLSPVELMEVVPFRGVPMRGSGVPCQFKGTAWCNSGIKYDISTVSLDYCCPYVSYQEMSFLNEDS